MSDSPSPVPDGFLRQVLDEFGIQWTHIAIFSGVVISSLGLESYLHVGAWMLVAMVSFTLVYLFRRQVTASFPRAAGMALVVVVGLLGAPVAITLRSGSSVEELASSSRVAVTIYVALVVITPLAYLIASYRKQESLSGGPYPKEIQSAISTNLVEAPIYRRDQLYDIRVTEVSADAVVLQTELSYTLVNRTKTAQGCRIGFVTPSAGGTLLKAEIGGVSLDPSDPDYKGDRGLAVDRVLPPGGELAVSLVATEHFKPRDSELFTAYAPTTALTLRLDNPYATIDFNVESLLPRKVDVREVDGRREWAWSDGLLPFQGFRLHWNASRSS